MGSPSFMPSDHCQTQNTNTKFYSILTYLTCDKAFIYLFISIATLALGQTKQTDKKAAGHDILRAHKADTGTPPGREGGVPCVGGYSKECCVKDLHKGFCFQVKVTESYLRQGN